MIRRCRSSKHSAKTLLDLSQEKTVSECITRLYDYYSEHNCYPDMVRLPEDARKELSSACSIPSLMMDRYVDARDISVAEAGYAQWGMFKGIPVIL